MRAGLSNAFTLGLGTPFFEPFIQYSVQSCNRRSFKQLSVPSLTQAPLAAMQSPHHRVLHLGQASPRSWCSRDASLNMAQNTSCETDTWCPARKKPVSPHRRHHPKPHPRETDQRAENDEDREMQKKREVVSLWPTSFCPS